MQCGAAVGAGEESGRLPADQRAELVMRSRGRAAVAVGGHDAEIGRQRGAGNDRLRMQMQIAE